MMSSDSGAVEKDKASAEQLLEYIKKQKLKIKRLQTENDALTKSLSSVQLIDKDKSGPNAAESEPEPGMTSSADPQHRQKSSKAAAANMLNLARYLDLFHKTETPHTLRSSFMHWKLLDSLGRLTSLSKELETAKTANTAMEQRITKLKALLARTHQANQRNLEEFDNLKKAQKNAEGELKSAEMKTNAELNSLKEVVRATSITSAFQYDIDILIQNAGILFFDVSSLFVKDLSDS